MTSPPQKKKQVSQGRITLDQLRTLEEEWINHEVDASAMMVQNSEANASGDGSSNGAGISGSNNNESSMDTDEYDEVFGGVRIIQNPKKKKKLII